MEFKEGEQEVEMAVIEAMAGFSNPWVWPGSWCVSHPRTPDNLLYRAS
jgi:hypothetical protein